MLVVADEVALTDTGLQRQTNEDAFFIRAPVYAVADGMGGARGGEIASRIATEALESVVVGQQGDEETLRAVIVEANRKINDVAVKDASRSGMGTTLTAAIVGESSVSIAHVGDSRAYMFRDGELTKLTRDHSLVEELKRQGQLTEKEAEEHPQRSIITRALGPEPEVKVDTHTHSARDGDVFLLCSDGLSNMVSEEEVAEVLKDTEELTKSARYLVALANKHGGRDNITVVAFRLAEVKQEHHKPQQEVGETLVGSEAEKTGESLREAIRDKSGEGGAGAYAPEATMVLKPRREADSLAKGRTGVDRRMEAPVSTPSKRVRPRRVVTRRLLEKDVQSAGRRRWLRGLALIVIVAVLLAAASIGAATGIRQVYFLGTDADGLVSVYRGVPYELPSGINLYSQFYQSTVPAGLLTTSQRKRILDHDFRSRTDALDLIKRLETGEIERH